MTTYTIGIDTGGTYTDAVLLESSTGRIVACCKERTTHQDLSLGVAKALSGLLQKATTTAAIAGLAVSTTLATNAVVEGRGARVGLFVFGYVRHFKLPVVANIFLKGGHTITGEEDEPLDIEGLVDTLPGLANEVDSYAVCSAMSIKNPTHELVAQEAIRLIDPKPVFCSHLVSTHPGMLERAATACLHAKLMPLMQDFLGSIHHSMTALGLHCPVTIICGNGQGAPLDTIAEQAAVTMASGPAATARFGTTSGLDSALVVDVGGTTTDVCLIHNGQPLLNQQGCVIGQWRTHVEAVDMFTAGTGGDSQVVCHQDGRITLRSIRVQPLAMTPELPDPATWLHHASDPYLVLPVAGLDPKLVHSDPILAYVAKHGPASPSTLATATGIFGVLLEKRLERLMFLQQVVLTGFTPTDALHGLGQLDIGVAEASRRGALVLGKQVGLTSETLCQRVFNQTVADIETILLTYLAGSVWPETPSASLLDHRENHLFSVAFSLKVPIIGIGAAARCFLPTVAERLRTTVVFPEHCEVGNAIGAALIGRAGGQA